MTEWYTFDWHVWANGCVCLGGGGKRRGNDNFDGFWEGLREYLPLPHPLALLNQKMKKKKYPGWIWFTHAFWMNIIKAVWFSLFIKNLEIYLSISMLKRYYKIDSPFTGCCCCCCGRSRWKGLVIVIIETDICILHKNKLKGPQNWTAPGHMKVLNRALYCIASC